MSPKSPGLPGLFCFCGMWMTLLATSFWLVLSSRSDIRQSCDVFELSSRAMFLCAEREERLSRDLGSCQHNAALRARTNPGPSLALTAQARLGRRSG